MQPFQYDLRSSAAKDYYACSRCTKQPWRSHYNAICRDWVAKHNRTRRKGVGNCSSKTGSRRQSDKKTILKHFLKGILKGKLLAPKLRKSADKSLSQPWCSHSNTIYDLQLQKTITHAAAAPSNLDAATTMRFAASRSKPAPIYGRGNTKWQQSCSHSNAICHHSFKKRIELRTQEQPLVAKHIGGTIRDRKDRSRTRRTHEVPFIAGCSHFTRKNTRFRAPASSPQHSPCNIHAAIPMRSATTASRNA